MSDPNILEYRDYRTYLRDWFAARDGRPSVRGFAKRAHCSPSLVSAVIRGHRDLHTGKAEVWAGVMGLSDEETAILLNLVTAEHDPSAERREQAESLVEGARALHECRVVDQATLALLSHWYVGAVVELARCEAWHEDPDWIVARLSPLVSREQAVEALEILRTLGLLHDAAAQVASASAVYRTAQGGVTDEDTRRALFQLHHDVLGLAGRALDQVPSAERQYGTTTFAVPVGLVPELKARVARFQDEIMRLVADARDRPDRVYHLGVQLFPLSAPPPVGRR